MLLRVLRRFFPKRSPCPKCHHVRARVYAHSADGGLQYRRCEACAHEFKVTPCAKEICDEDMPKRPSWIVSTDGDP